MKASIASSIAKADNRWLKLTWLVINECLASVRLISRQPIVMEKLLKLDIGKSKKSGSNPNG